MKVGGGDREAGVAELALDDVEPHALPGELAGVGVSELVVVPTSAQPPLSRLGR